MKFSLVNHLDYNDSFEVSAVPIECFPSAPIAAIAVELSDETNQHSCDDFNKNEIHNFLANHNWPVGLQKTLTNILSKIAYRFIICDDSGSMSTYDGKKLISSKHETQSLKACTRWDELTQALKFHSELARVCSAPTEFRMLNGASPFLVGIPDDDSSYKGLIKVLNRSPGGGTPLCRHIREVVMAISLIEANLRANNQKALVVIATDGESSDGDIAQAMKPLKDLPVVRLCTDEERIVEYWNNIDADLELDMDVLDDLSGEAAEIAEHNPWLTYGEPLHRLREFGCPVRELDLLDEMSLSLEQIRQMCVIIYGGKLDDYPHPDTDFEGFCAAIERKNKSTPQVWSPVTRCLKPWIDVNKLIIHKINMEIRDNKTIHKSKTLNISKDGHELFYMLMFVVAFVLLLKLIN